MKMKEKSNWVYNYMIKISLYLTPYSKGNYQLLFWTSWTKFSMHVYTFIPHSVHLSIHGELTVIFLHLSSMSDMQKIPDDALHYYYLWILTMFSLNLPFFHSKIAARSALYRFSLNHLPTTADSHGIWPLLEWTLAWSKIVVSTLTMF